MSESSTDISGNLRTMDTRTVDLAYQYVLPSYEWAFQRNDAVEARLQSAIAYISAATVGAPTVAKAFLPGISFHSPLFFFAMLLYVAAMGAGIFGRLHGTLKVVHPTVLLNQWLSDSETDFKMGALKIAGENLDSNKALIKQRHDATTWALACFGCEIVLLVLWFVLAVTVG